MARHRNVRSMNYADEYDGYDDVYGHSVEDDYSISPSDAKYVFDRNTEKAQMSAFLTGDEDIAEDDEDVEEGVTECPKRRDSDTLGLRTRNLSDLDEARLRSCLDEIRDVIGDSISEASLADIILANDFDVSKSLDAALSNAAENSKRPSKIKKQDVPLPQREPRVNPVIDDNAAVLSSLKAGVRAIDLDKGEASNLTSSKLTFKVPKLFRPVMESDKENIHAISNNPSSLSESMNFQCAGLNGKSLENNLDSSRNSPGLKSLNIPSLRKVIPPLSQKLPQTSRNDEEDDGEHTSLSSLMALHAAQTSSANAVAPPQTTLGSLSTIPKSKSLSIPSHPKTLNKIPQLFRKVSDGSVDEESDEEGSTLSSLMAQHASNKSTPEHTSLSALADFHLKGSNLNPSPKSEFLIPSLKVQSKGISPPSSCFLETDTDNLNADFPVMDESNKNNDEFVIDLLDALNPPDFRKQLERPRSRMDTDNFGENDGAGCDASKPWIQDRTCILDARSFLLMSLPMELSASSPVGRILCRRRNNRKSPYVRPSSPFMGDIVPFTFNTPSPDSVIQKSLRRL